MSQAAIQLSSVPDPYSLLEARVSELAGELAVVSAQRMAELAEKSGWPIACKTSLICCPAGSS